MDYLHVCTQENFSQHNPASAFRISLWSTAMSNCPEQHASTMLMRHGPAVVNALRTVGHYSGSEVKNDINTVQFLAQTDCFDCFDSQSRGSHWLPLYDWQTATVWVKYLCLCSTEETKSPTSWMPWGKQINITFSFFGVNYPCNPILGQGS